MKLKIPNKPYSLVELYDTVATKMGYTNVSELQYDCRNINIAANIQDSIYEHYFLKAKETKPTPSENDIKIGTTMLLAMSGPKVDVHLEADEVEIFDGFIC